MPFYPDPIEEYEEDDDHVYCRGCEGHLGRREDLTPEIARFWNGWWWCPEHAAAMERMSKTPDPVNQVRR